MRRLAAIVVGAFAIATSCSSGGSAATPTPLPTTTAPPRPTSSVTVSDAIPPLEALIEIGLTESQAACFIAEIDPEGTGRLTDAELFGEAWAACL